MPSKSHSVSYARFATGGLTAFSKSCSVMILYKLRIAPCFALSQSYRYEHFHAACASLRAHTCCLRNRIQSLTRASRATSLSAFSKSLYNKNSSCPVFGTRAVISPAIPPRLVYRNCRTGFRSRGLLLPNTLSFHTPACAPD